MNKKLISILLCVSSVLSLTSCGQNDKIKNQTKKNVSDKSSSEEPEKKSYSSAFSSDDLIYFIMTDRFMDGNENNNLSDVDKKNPKKFHGGDFEGVTQKLDYIKSLGATAIWLTPVVENESDGYHGYWTSDFYKVEPHLGDMDSLKILVDEAHKRDIKVLFDQVVNHTGYKSDWLKDSQKSKWFHPRLDISNWNDKEQVEKGWLAGLPDLDQSNEEVRDYLVDNALWWISETGIDGMRLDTVKHVPEEFWEYYTSEIKKEYPDFYFLGEVWNDNPRYLEKYHQAGIDGITDYSLYKGIREAFTRYGKTNSLVSAIKGSKAFSNKELNGIFIDNHDNTRLITSGGDNGEAVLMQSLAFLMTYPSIPVVYYGTEIGLEGGSDPDNRRDMPWDIVSNNKSILPYYKSLVTFRSSSSALKSHTIELLSYDSKFLSYRRSSPTEDVVVIFNLLNKEKPVEIDLKDAEDTEYKDMLTQDNFTAKDNKLNIILKPLDVKILTTKK